MPPLLGEARQGVGDSQVVRDLLEGEKKVEGEELVREVVEVVVTEV